MNQRLFLPAMAAILSACSPMPASVSTPLPSVITPQLHQYHWQLVEATNSQGQWIDDLLVRADQPLTLDFDASSVNVSNSCNRLGASYQIDPQGQLVVSAIRQTMMACLDPTLHQLDHAISSRLQGTLSLTIQTQPNDPPRLVLKTNTGDLLSFTGNPTAETRFGSVGKIVFLEVAPQSVPCDSPSKTCLSVREVKYDANGLKTGQSDTWQPLAQGVEDFRFEEGVRSIIRVKQFGVKRSTNTYILDMIVESEKINP